MTILLYVGVKQGLRITGPARLLMWDMELTIAYQKG